MASVVLLLLHKLVTSHWWGKDQKVLTCPVVINQVMLELFFISKKSLKIPKGQSESVSRRTDIIMTKIKRTKGPTTIYKHTLKTKDRVTLTPLKPGVGSSCSTRGTRRVTLVTNPGAGKDWEVLTTSKTYPWSSLTQIFRSGKLVVNIDSMSVSNLYPSRRLPCCYN